MQFIKKQLKEPNDWNLWFTTATGRRTFDYGADYSELTLLHNAKKYLLDEQKGLCAYCQKKIQTEGASIEHVIPKAHNKGMSTSYFNLVVVCKSQVEDPASHRVHCDKERGSMLLPGIIFYKNSCSDEVSSNFYFDVYLDGTIQVKHNLDAKIKQQVSSFIDILNLNHSLLAQSRAKDVLQPIVDVFRNIPGLQKKDFLKAQRARILRNESHPYREFLLIYINKQLGMN